MMLHEIIDHCVLNEAIPKDKGIYETQIGTKRRVRTTRGWEIFVSWKDASTEWIALEDLKHSYPV